MPSLFTLNKTSHLSQIIGDEWARHHYEENQKKFRESEVYSQDMEEDPDDYVVPDEDIVDFIDQQTTFFASLPPDELQRRLNKEPFADAIVYLQENLNNYKNPIDK